jgi:hypothetical protein
LVPQEDRDVRAAWCAGTDREVPAEEAGGWIVPKDSDGPDTEPQVVKEHWLHGKCYFNVDVEKESECRLCIHSVMCRIEMERFCKNFEYGCSGEQHCGSCIHHYTRYSNKQKIPCFSCWFFEPRKNNPALRRSKLFFVYSNPGGDEWWRVGVCTKDVGPQVRAFLDNADNDVLGHRTGAELLFVPITENEFDYVVKKWIKEQQSSLVNFTPDYLAGVDLAEGESKSVTQIVRKKNAKRKEKRSG